MAAAPPDAAAGAGPRLAVLVVNWRREEATLSCVRAVRGWRELRPRILVVDNGSDDAALAVLRRELGDGELLLSRRNRGFGGANNLALPHLGAPLTLLLNNDAEIDEAAVAALLDFLDGEPRAGIAGPLIVAPQPPHAIVAAGGRDPARHGRTHATEAERAPEIARGRPFTVDYVPGTAALVRSALLLELGGFHEEFFFSGEMADLCARARDLGLESYVVPAARARHDLEAAGEHRRSLYPYYSLRNRFLLVRRRASGGSAALSLLAWTLRGGGRALGELARGRTRLAGALARAVVDGVRGRFGPADDGVRA